MGSAYRDGLPETVEAYTPATRSTEFTTSYDEGAQ